jgi:L-ascorbate metabolism protein UlaG (beta-lactamase superfamily)
MFKIKHIFHSGFVIEYPDYLIMMDVFTDLDQFKNKKIYCFSTHSHGDHFTPELMNLSEHNDVTYIFSDDIQAGEGVRYVKDGDVLALDDMEIKVFGTTDLGVSFYIKRGDTVFFHSGDLNWWHWEDNDKEKQLSEKMQYQSEIQRLKGLKINYAFVPVDYRLKTANRYAMDYFIEILKPENLIPMHFADRYDSVKNLTTNSKTKLIISQSRNSYIL